MKVTSSSLAHIAEVSRRQFAINSPDFASDWCLTPLTIWPGNSWTVSPGQRLQRGQEILPSQNKGRPWARARRILNQPRRNLTNRFQNIFGRESKARIHFESSHMSAGLQIADVVANSVFQSLSLPYPMLVRPRKSCYSLFLRLKSYPEITPPTENYEQTPQIR